MKTVVKIIKKNKFTQMVLFIFRVLFFVPYIKVVKQLNIHILDPLQTADILVKNKKSLARFGDGEFNLIFKKKSIGFQDYSEEIRDDLLNVLKNDEILIGLPHSFNSTNLDIFRVKAFWWSYVVNNRKEIKEMISHSSRTTYLDASFTRTITEVSNKTIISNVLVEIKKIWNEKVVLIVEGEGTKFGVGNDLLIKAQQVSRIVAPAENAYNVLCELKEEIHSFLNNQADLQNVVVLVALGPTATILVSEFNSWVQIIDIGHFDLQYEYFQKGFYKKVQIESKYDNEMVSGNHFINMTDSGYDDEVIKLLNKKSKD